MSDPSPAPASPLPVYYFWETLPGSRFPDYLALCVESWGRNIPNAEVIRVSRANLAEHSGGRVDPKQLELFSLPLQSDVAAIAVLAERPGLFLDADTVILPGFTPAAFSESRLTMFGDPTHKEGGHATNFFVAPRSENEVLLRWLDEVNRRAALQNRPLPRLKWWLRRLLRHKPARVGWNYLGNAILDPLLRDHDFHAAIDLLDASHEGYVQTDHFCEHYERVTSYLELWYDKEIPEDEVVAEAAKHAVCLQHSWTPDWYSALDRDAVLADDHLISRLIRHALHGAGP